MKKLPAVLLPLPLGEVDANVVSRRRGRIAAENLQKLPPQRRAFVESGAANAVFLYDPTREKGVLKSPQAFQNPKISNNSSAEYA